MTAKEKSIISSGPMVLALLDGRKTQSRWTVKPQPRCNSVGQWLWKDHAFHPDLDEALYPQTKLQHVCPYGVPGDRLWVRETWQSVAAMHICHKTDDYVVYRATDSDWDNYDGWKWRSPIYMPRWASRITLEVSGVRVERLNEISENDARAEGVECECYDDGQPISGCWFDYQTQCWSGAFPNGSEARGSFQTLWDSINGQTYPWSSDPFVWAITFRRIQS